jgi:ribonuclease HII
MSTDVGRMVESIVAQHLVKKGYTLIEQNWRTKWCEIDLVMSKDNTMCFVEVKYRSTSDQGEGTEYVTPKKLVQMRRAAESWDFMHDHDGDLLLMVASVDGANSRIKIIEIQE